MSNTTDDCYALWCQNLPFFLCVLHSALMHRLRFTGASAIKRADRWIVFDAEVQKPGVIDVFQTQYV
eukprot:6641747-Lingulodinium_polyedra.AAC.1